ncbi:acetyl/propionyl/methylcrotonyl-CoA carboxylase subunit alpha [Cryptosporangium aurantiacum]|uniref:Biotin-dependent 3-methylcrotonyl-coenzyme A carboxylase alpha1 subunit n=1 Tax=Cryptosporangium aurantiacum TaxID=134849 RepID=A0A1M7RKD3_9ACTN|nr:biotin carboxylase N-terminal domain-containing protein [Cryptosporangium aurantiacum]SHN46724.1 acetyl-CoA/propionyl-CoA carboxylase, biotin carboxylase, biotin carboxyl carrier protein [Cryptosporangium aurantiacum]
MTSDTLFSTVLVANRGEIAVRVIRTLRRLGIRSVAVYSDADADAPHVTAADVAVRIGPPPAAESYLSIDAILDAARATGAEAIHPGYGFLSENTDFAAACETAGVVFIGPPSSAIDAMGDKIRAKQTVAKAGVPVVPGSDAAGLSDDELVAAVAETGFPVLLKPSAGGGGKGMREVHAADDVRAAIASARREARSSFGDDTLLVERLITTPRHIEIQVLADAHGNVVHLGERECSLQRRHQKIIEEAPSPLLREAQREAMGAAACEAARACGYVGAGTVEFIVAGDRPDDWFFMEMNTRLQVEHPVTEEVYGVDLVEAQLRVAAGERAPWPAELTPNGHAVEARIYAEDPAAGFLPTGGRILALREPSGVRVDSGIAEGGYVGSDYDPMLAKVIAYGTDRAEALRRLDAALADTVLLGLGTNIGFLRALLADPDVRAGDLDTGLVGRRLESLTTQDLPADVVGVATGIALLELEPSGSLVDPFDIPGGWRLGGPAWTTRRLAVGHDTVEVRYRGRASDAEISIDGGEPIRISTRHGGVHTQGGVTRTYAIARDPSGVVWIGRDGRSWAIHPHEALDAVGDAATGSGGPVLSPMPGAVTVLAVSEGEHVTTGQTLAVVEAMKMEHVLSAPVDGTVSGLRARVGANVAKDAVLMSIETGADHGS